MSLLPSSAQLRSSLERKFPKGRDQLKRPHALCNVARSSEETHTCSFLWPREQRTGEKGGCTGSQMWFSLPVNFLSCLPTSPRKLLEQVAARTVIHVDAPEIICLTRSREQRGAFTRTWEKGLDTSILAFLERRLPPSQFRGTPTDDTYETRIIRGPSLLPVPNLPLFLLPSNVSQARHSLSLSLCLCPSSSL